MCIYFSQCKNLHKEYYIFLSMSIDFPQKPNKICAYSFKLFGKNYKLGLDIFIVSTYNIINVRTYKVNQTRGTTMNIYDIAELAGVSIATVSRVLNDSPNVAEKTKLKVRRILEENNYVPSGFLRGLSQNAMKTIGIICPDVADNYMAKAVSYLVRRLQEYGYDCVLSCSGYVYEDCQIAVSSILQRHVDALIMIGSNYVDNDPDSEKVNYVREAARQVPVFLINGYIRGENICSALCDDFNASYTTVKEMLQSGRKNIMFLCDSHSFSTNQKRRGYETALNEAGVPVQESLSICIPNQINQIRNYLLELPNLDIDGVFATEDGLAAGVLKYAKQKGLSVPKDLCIIGYNNSEVSVCCNPELSTIDSRGDRLCQIVIDSLKLRLNGKKINDKIYAKGYLIRRLTSDF